MYGHKLKYVLQHNGRMVIDLILSLSLDFKVVSGVQLVTGATDPFVVHEFTLGLSRVRAYLIFCLFFCLFGWFLGGFGGGLWVLLSSFFVFCAMFFIFF